MSKSARKKFLKRQAWEAARPARKEAKKAKAAQRKEQARAERASALDNGDPLPPPTSKGVRNSTRHRMAAATPPLPVGIVLDCGFDELMTEKEIVSLASQVTRCYAENARAAPCHAHLVVAGLNGRLLERFDGVMRGCYKQWRGVEIRTEPLEKVLPEIKFDGNSPAAAATQMAALPSPPWSLPLPDPPGCGDAAQSGATDDEAAAEAAEAMDAIDANGSDAAEKSKIPVARTVYLSADASETLRDLRPYDTYIVGALVDRNRHKNICAKRAAALGLPVAKLPLAEHLQMASRKVLATNHVVEIMLKYLAGHGWKGALEEVVPKRKGAVVKGREKEEDDEEGGEGDEGEEDEVKEGKGGGGEQAASLPHDGDDEPTPIA